jgi:hypothetical protein
MAKEENKIMIPDESIINTTFLVRGKKIMLDADLAALYGIETRLLKRAVNRHPDRFPGDFMFELTKKERNQLVEQNQRLGNIKFSPSNSYAFTEHGVVMLASVLNTPMAVKMSIHVTRVFVGLREMIQSHKDLLGKLNEMEEKYDHQFRVVFDAIKELMDPEKQERKPVGFN